MVILIAQNCTFAVCRAAVLTDEKCVGVDLPLAKCLSESFGLATDDICHFTTRGEEPAQKVWNRIDRAFQKLVLAVIRPSGSLVLWMVHASEKAFFPKQNIMDHLSTNWHIFCTHIVLDGLAGVLGGERRGEVCQWFDLLAWPHLSLFFHCHEFARRMPQTTPQTLPTIVPSELFSLPVPGAFLGSRSAARGRPLLWPLTRLMHLVLAFALQLTTPITIADWDVFCVDHQAWQS